MERLIHNCSMPRSGSELLQVILHQDPRIYGSATSPLLEYQFAARANYDLPEVKSQEPDLMRGAFLSMCRGMAESYYAAITDRPIICDKNRGWSHYWEWVGQWNPEPKMICVVRDLRSILASMERIYRANRHRPTGPDNPQKLANMTVQERASHWLSSPPVGLALQRTLDLFQRGLADKILFVRYEDLCAHPAAELARIYAYLEVDPWEHDFRNLVKQVAEDDTHYGPYGRHRVAPEIKPPPPRDWEGVLSAPIAARVAAAAPWYFDVFHYSLGGGK